MRRLVIEQTHSTEKRLSVVGSRLNLFSKVLLRLFSLSHLIHPALLSVVLIADKLHDASVLGLHSLPLQASPLISLSLEFLNVLLSGSDLLQFDLLLPGSLPSGRIHRKKLLFFFLKSHELY